MKIPLRERNLNAGLFEGLEQGKVNPAADPARRHLPEVNPY
jgi:hypothetical protein